MTFRDLTTWDLDLIRSHGINALNFDRNVKNRYQAVTQCTLNCIRLKGFNVVPKLDNLQKIVSEALVPKHTSMREPSFEELVESVFEFVSSIGLSIVRDESRESTWTVPKESWYSKTEPKKPWVY